MLGEFMVFPNPLLWILQNNYGVHQAWTFQTDDSFKRGRMKQAEDLFLPLKL
jgi:hypothetical protein